MKLFVFDLDNTLIDLLKIHDTAINKAFREFYSISARFSEVDYAGKSILCLIRELSEIKDISTNEDKLIAEYEKNMTTLIPRKVKPLKYGKMLLEFIKDKGYVASLYTGSRNMVAEKALKNSGLRKYFRYVAGSDNHMKRHKILEEVIRRSGFKRKDVTVIGDSINDIRAAKKLGVRSIGVTTGIHSRQRLLKEKPDAVVKDLRQVMRYV